MKLLERRKTALKALESQLKRGDKPRKNGKSWKEYPQEDLLFDLQSKPYAIKLSTKDVDRIKSQILILKIRV